MTGDASLRRRPMRRVIDPLTATGARFASRGGGLLPLAIEGAREALPLDYRVPVPSAQVKSAVLLAGLNARGITRVEEPEATRDHSENMLRHFGATVQSRLAGDGRVIDLQGQPELRAADVVVPGDPSSAAFPLVAALLVPGVLGDHPVGRPEPAAVPACSLTLDEMGAAMSIAEPPRRGRRTRRRPRRYRRRVARCRCAAGACAQHDRRVSHPGRRRRRATGVTRLRGLKELRVKESDRLSATAALLSENGVRVEIEGDDLIMHGTGAPPAGGGTVERTWTTASRWRRWCWAWSRSNR